MKSTLEKLFRGTWQLPILESLHLESCNDTDSDADAWVLPCFILISELRSLSLHNVTLSHVDDWDALVNLTHLSLESTRTIMYTRPTFHALINALKRSPRLQTLKINTYIEEASDDPTLSVTLSDLRMLDLDMSVELVNALLRCITMPATTAIDLTPRGISTSTAESLKTLLFFLRPHFHRAASPILRAFRIEGGHSMTYVRVSLFTEPVCPGRFLENASQEHFALQIHPRTQSALRKVLTKVLSMFPFHRGGQVFLDATSLVISQQWQLWMNVFRTLAVPVTVEIGMNVGVISMLEGLLAAMQAGRMRKRRSLRAYPFDLKLAQLRLVADLHPSSIGDNGPDMNEQKQLWGDFLDLLTEYRDSENLAKPPGVRVGTVAVGSIKRGFTYVYQVIPRLYELTDELVIKDRVWDATLLREWVVQMKEALTERYDVPRELSEALLPESVLVNDWPADVDRKYGPSHRRAIRTTNIVRLYPAEYEAFHSLEFGDVFH